MSSPRQDAYRLLARLWLAEIDAPLAETLRGLPGFAEHIPAKVDAAWRDEMAAEYQRVFAQNVHPYESMFVGDDLMLNSDATRRVAALYDLGDFAPTAARIAAADHLGIELLFMAHLIAAEEEGRDPTTARRLQARFLGEHLLWWAPVCALTVARLAPHPIYGALAQLTWELALADASLSPLRDKTLTQPLPEGEEPERLEPSPLGRGQGEGLDAGSEAPERREPSPPGRGQGEGLDAEGESLGQVVRALLTPARVGVFLCREDVRRVGRTLGLPTPLGDRFAMLRALFEAAAQFDLLPALLDALDALWRDADAGVAALTAEAPAWSPYGEQWRARLAAGRGLTSEIRKSL